MSSSSSSAFHLRPVGVERSPSSSPTENSRPSGTLLPSPAESASVHFGHRSRMGTARPMSPSQLRELDLTHDPDSSSHPRKYPAPPTGHDLMAMFPPAPPSIYPARGQNTSGYFQRQERAFFAQAGKEIVRVRVEVDLPHGSGSPHDDKARHPMDPGPRSWAPSPAHSHSHPSQPPPPPPPPSARRNGPVPVNPSPLFPHPMPNKHDPSPPAQKMDYDNDSADADEAWKRPMPYNERRRAGKHTRRVIVRN